MDKLIKYFENIEASFRRTKLVTYAALAASVVISLGSVFIATRRIDESRGEVYVIDGKSALMASRRDADSYRDIEAEDHVIRFHEMMFNITPNSESIKRNLDRALLLSDRSAYDYYMDLSEKGFYQRMVSANISQEIAIDSVKVDMSRYPHPARTYGKIYLLRESNITAYSFKSECQIVDVNRSPSNPHGMMIEKFTVTANEKIGTRVRK